MRSGAERLGGFVVGWAARLEGCGAVCGRAVVAGLVCVAVVQRGG